MYNLVLITWEIHFRQPSLDLETRFSTQETSTLHVPVEQYRMPPKLSKMAVNMSGLDAKRINKQECWIDERSK